ncbi:unnamed protein product [Rotaria magnacalcarata]|uniref:Uncharacterized protein n=2 Tax=Rotaria magnacalcarata TaxID=392030 RepID=A0A819LNU9_9BILA|nr:unnamed protein product [Rotaria magnacalcarata]
MGKRLTVTVLCHVPAVQLTRSEKIVIFDYQNPYESSLLEIDTQLQVPQSAKNLSEIQEYVRELNVIDNQRILNQLSNKLEPRQT